MARYDAVSQAAIDFLASASYPPYDHTLRGVIEAKHPGAIERARAKHKKAREEARFVGNPPAFVRTYIRKYAPKISRVVWRRSRIHSLSSGVCDGWQVTVTAGSDEIDQRVVLLHEIAHYRRPGAGHNDRFHDEWYRLLKAENLYRVGANRLHGRNLKAAARRARTRRLLTSAK